LRWPGQRAQKSVKLEIFGQRKRSLGTGAGAGLQIDNLSSFVLHFDGLVDNDFCVELAGDAVS